MLEEEYVTLYKSASSIKDWKSLTKNELANAYIDNEKDESLKNAYFSALMLRYWGNIGRYYTSSKSSGFTIEECYSWLLEALLYALEKRKWRDPNNPLSKDKNAPDKVINRCIYSRRQYYYYLSNTDKRKSNHNKISIENNEELKEDYNVFLEDTSSNMNFINEDILTVSSDIYKRNKWFESFLLIFLCSDDFSKWDKEEKKWDLNLQKIVDNINNLDYEEFTSIMEKLKATNKEINDYYQDIKYLNKNKTRNLVSRCLKDLRKNEALKSLCY